MYQIILGFMILIVHGNADIIYMTIKKEGKSINVEHIEMNDKETFIKVESGHMLQHKNKNDILSLPIANFWLTKNDIIYKYKKFTILNRKDIKKPFTKTDNNIRIMIKEKNYMEKFKILAKPDRPKYYWKEIEKNYITYSTPELKKILNKKDYEKLMWKMNY